MTDDMRRDVEMYRDWDEIVNSYLCAILDMKIYLDKTHDEKSIEKIRGFDRAMKAFKEKYPEKFS